MRRPARKGAVIAQPRHDPRPAGETVARGGPPIARTSLPDAVFDRLAGRILDGDLTAGDRLPGERALADALGVSRIVVREALGRLRARGLIEIRPGVGAFVVPMPERSVTDPLGLYIRRHGVSLHHLFELRRALEPQLAASAARQRSPAALEALRTTQRQTEAACESLAAARGPAALEAALEAFAWSDVTFHQQLAHASGNPLFELLLVPLLAPLLEVRRDGARHPGAARHAAAQHAAVLDAVIEGDPDAAAAAMAAHLDAVAAWLRAVRPKETLPKETP